MEMKHIDIQKGNIAKEFYFDISSSVSKLRKNLVDDAFISEDNDIEAWRFMMNSATDTLNYNDVVLPVSTEIFLKVRDLLNGEKRICLTNTKKPKPDLMGIPTEWFTDRSMEVQIKRNDSVSGDKFRPFMLEHVVPTNPDSSADFENAFICEKDTAVKFSIRIDGHDGFCFSIKPDKGDHIAEEMFYHETDNPSAYKSTVSLSRYQHVEQNIVVDSTEALNIPTQEAVKYQRIYIKAWKYISYRRNGILHTIDNSTSRSKRDISYVPSDSIETGTVKAFGHSNQVIGSVSDVMQDRNVVLGEILVHCFIFKSRADAETVIGYKNLPRYSSD